MRIFAITAAKFARISDGIKYGTQIVGGVVTLIMLSPHMTFATGITVPILVTIGSLYGRYDVYSFRQFIVVQIFAKAFKRDARDEGNCVFCLVRKSSKYSNDKSVCH